MSDQRIIFSPERNQWTLADGRHHMEVPEWAREIMRDEFERETRPLRDSLDLALDSKRIAERRVTELLAENAKLREQIHWLKKGDIMHVLTDQEYFNQCERERLMQVSIDALDKDNAKLRELVEDMLDCIDIQIAFERVPARWMQDEFTGRARELGVECGDDCE